MTWRTWRPQYGRERSAQRSPGMRTTITAIGASALILSVANVLLLLLRSDAPSVDMVEIPTGRILPPSSLSSSSLPPASYWEPVPTKTPGARADVVGFWDRWWLGHYGSTSKPLSELLDIFDRGLSRCPTARRPTDDQVRSITQWRR